MRRATGPRRRWPSACCTAGPSASAIRACAMPAGPASRASVRRWWPTCAATGRIASPGTAARRRTSCGSVRRGPGSGAAADLGDPPAQADEEEAPVVEELGRLALEGMADDVHDPADKEQRERDGPEAADEQRDHEQRQRQRDQRNAERVAEPVDRVLMALRVLRDPLVPRASTEHLYLRYRLTAWACPGAGASRRTSRPSRPATCRRRRRPP